jgi:Tfp pilus assembly protein PilF
MYDIALTASKYKDDKNLNQREKLHLRALHYLLHDEYRIALSIYLKILQSCPGDALALSLLMDLSQTLGDKDSALRYEISHPF